MPCQQITNTGVDYNPPLATRSGPFTSEADCLNACKEGACCESNGTCNVRPQCQCQGAGQTFQGIGTVCSPNPCGCPCVGPPFFDTPGNSSLRGQSPAIGNIAVQITDGPAIIRGEYSLVFVYPTDNADYQANGYRWTYAANIPGGAMSINVRFGPTIVACSANTVNCGTQAYVRVFAFGEDFFFSGVSGTPAQSTLAGCTLPCGNVITNYAVSHSGFASGSAPSTLSLVVALPTDYTNHLP